MVQVNAEMENLTVSVVICTKNREQDLKTCVDSIISQTHMPDEIVIVDSSDNDLTRLLVTQYKNNHVIPVRYIHTLPGLTKQRNIGIKKSNGTIIAFLDDDVILDKDYFKEIIRCFMISDKIAGVGGLATNVKGENILKKIFRKIFMLSSTEGTKGVMKRSGFANYHPMKIDKVYTTQVLSGYSCCYRRPIFDQYIFDEYFEGYSLMEDLEFSYRVSKENTLVYTPYAKLVHNMSPAERLNSKRLFEMRVLNHFYVFKKDVKKTNVDWIFFWWSDFGVILASLSSALKMKSTLPLAGVFSGHRKLFRHMY